jgi:hypothetical protein
VSGLRLDKGKGEAPKSISLQSPDDLDAALSSLGLEARIRLVGQANGAAVWEGKLVRLSESVDPTRDTLGLTILVDKPYQDIIPGKRPPLLKGMYTSVALLSPARPTLVLPRAALHEGRVYIAKSDNTLSIQAVDVLFAQDDLVVVNDAKENSLVGKRIIVTDVIPVLDGLPLKPIEATAFQAQLGRSALGELRTAVSQ